MFGKTSLRGLELTLWMSVPARAARFHSEAPNADPCRPAAKLCRLLLASLRAAKCVLLPVRVLAAGAEEVAGSAAGSLATDFAQQHRSQPMASQRLA